MINGLPIYISIFFIATTLLTLYFLFRASQYSKWCLIFALVWIAVQSFLSYNGFYLVTDSMPPRPVLMIGLPLLVILFLFLTAWGRKFIDKFDATTLTWLHIVRVPVEMVLFWLAAHQLVPDEMTFEGRNFDIFSGITAPFVALIGMKRKMLSRNVLLAWNFICLALLFNVVGHGILSIPSVIQQLQFENENIGLLYFPFNLLPAFIVPVVLFSHLVSIRYLLRKK